MDLPEMTPEQLLLIAETVKAAIEEERACVVAWARTVAEDKDNQVHIRLAYGYLAECIERGEHVPADAPGVDIDALKRAIEVGE